MNTELTTETQSQQREYHQTRLYERKYNLMGFGKIARELGISKKEAQLAFDSGLAKLREFLAANPEVADELQETALAIADERDRRINFFGEN